MARLLKAKKSDGTVVVLLPIDHLIWSQRVASVAGDMVQQGKADKAAGFEIWSLGTFSDRARSALESMGWKLHDLAKNDLVRKQ